MNNNFTKPINNTAYRLPVMIKRKYSQDYPCHYHLDHFILDSPLSDVCKTLSLYLESTNHFLAYHVLLTTGGGGGILVSNVGNRCTAVFVHHSSEWEHFNFERMYKEAFFFFIFHVRYIIPQDIVKTIENSGFYSERLACHFQSKNTATHWIRWILIQYSIH